MQEPQPTLGTRSADTNGYHLAQSQPGGVKAGLLRTFQRRVKLWRVAAGPKKEVFFTQDHKPGEVLGIKHIPIYTMSSIFLCVFAPLREAIFTPRHR